MLIFLLVAIDQVIKYFVSLNNPSIQIIPNVIEITYSENTGTIFGFFENNNIVFTIMAFIIIALITFIIYEANEKYSKERFWWKVIIAGGIGNLIDRIFRGYVLDYILIKPFGICNFSDIIIVVGVIMLLALNLFSIKTKKNGGK